MILFTETRCNIRFIYVGFNFKRKIGGKNEWEFMPLREGRGVRRLLANAIVNFHISLTERREAGGGGERNKKDV